MRKNGGREGGKYLATVPDHGDRGIFYFAVWTCSFHGLEICFPLPLVSAKLKVIILTIGDNGRIFYALPLLKNLQSELWSSLDIAELFLVWTASPVHTDNAVRKYICRTCQSNRLLIWAVTSIETETRFLNGKWHVQEEFLAFVPEAVPY